MSRIVIVSNRLPVNLKKRGGDFILRPSVGGLATGIGSLMDKDREILWIGWPGIAADKLTAHQKAEIERQLKELNYHPVFLTQRDIEGYYNGFSNNTIWPLFHYFTQHVVYEKRYWETYLRVNAHFAETVAKVLRPDDIVWVHDYQLLILPRLLRAHFPKLAIGFFLHIPFPSFEVFRLLPWRRDVLEGLLGADLIGFHTYDYTRHFLSSLQNRLGLEHSLGCIMIENRMVKVDTFPMGIDYDRYAGASQREDVQTEIRRVQEKRGDRTHRKLILSVDRLDYTKGIAERIHTYSLFLEKYPKYRGRVTLIMVAVPSRTNVEKYRQLKCEVDELVGRINGKYGTIGWMPVWYLYQLLSFEELTALYILSDVALITPVRDGMNLIAKEFIATKTDGKGVLILSEMAGVAREMSESLIVNPNNRDSVADAIHQAISMPEEEQIQRNRMMQKRLKRYQVKSWAEDFIGSLVKIKAREQEMQSHELMAKNRDEIIRQYKRSRKRIFLLDYDGTLRSFEQTPEKAKPDEHIIQLIDELAKDIRNEVVVISGRDKNTLGKWFKDLNISMVAEHGAWLHERGSIWELIEPLTDFWKDQIRPILEMHVDRTPGSFIEEKDYSLVWHYRKSDPALAEIRARELKEALLHYMANLGLGVLEGNKVIEIRIAGINKGKAALKWVAREYYDFILAAGDDQTDEDIFKILPPHAYSIKIGFLPTEAKYSLEQVTDLHTLLAELAG
ncbi:bifunctional alpha,alpha-trehalose-phosphate synthase (UDP-forming)/trehalose-phosphatase [Candidatus Latescibacterota bacterium]